MNILINIIHNSQKVRKNKCPSTDEQTRVAYPHNEILFSHKKDR